MGLYPKRIVAYYIYEMQGDGHVIKNVFKKMVLMMRFITPIRPGFLQTPPNPDTIKKLCNWILARYTKKNLICF